MNIHPAWRKNFYPRKADQMETQIKVKYGRSMEQLEEEMNKELIKISEEGNVNQVEVKEINGGWIGVIVYSKRKVEVR